MKTLLATLNAKYIHTSLALRLLYVANKDRYDIAFHEYTIKEEIAAVAEDILHSRCDILGLSVYIWNVTVIERLIRLLREQKPNLIIILGGPEVMYDVDYYLRAWPVDYVLSGDGEFVLGELIEALSQGENVDIDGVSSRDNVRKTVVRADLELLAKLPSPYKLEEDLSQMPNRLVYFETSRGCPYQCQYCLSSLEKGVRYYPQDYILDNLSYVIENGARLIKFLDRTFNLNKKHTRTIFDFLIQNYRPGLVCQFEIYADLLDDEMIDYLNENLPSGFFRFEIGIQSTYEPTNVAVRRKQDFSLLAKNIKRLMDGGKVDLHLDLIAGLPYETFDRFVKSFNDVFALEAKEVQLGFLKMLRGTNLRNNADGYGYKYNDAAPYEIEYNADISNEELDRIHEAEHALEKYWNSGRFASTMNVLFRDYYEGCYFEFFDEFAHFYKEQGYSHRGYQLENLFQYLHQFLTDIGIDLSATLRTDYYSNFSKRPNGYWTEAMDKGERKRLLYLIGQDRAFLKKHSLTRKIVEKQTMIDHLGGNEYLLTIFLEDGKIEVRYFLLRA